MSVKRKIILASMLLIMVLALVGGFFAIRSVLKKSALSDEEGCTITYKFNYKGAEDDVVSNVAHGVKTAPPELPEREGFIFLGWFEDSSLKKPFDFEIVVEESYTLYAGWGDLSDTTDTDGDGLLDVGERYYRTDIKKADSDSDGLSDYVEVVILFTNPLKKDTDSNGISDGDEDADADSIKNAKELEFGTDPALADTDFDGLSDFDEIERYSTDPLKKDTDSDGVSDGKEIELGTDPRSAQNAFSMNVVSDNEDSVKASVKVKLSGEQAETLSVTPVDNTDLFPEDMPGYMGKAYEFSVAGEFDSATISFEFDPSSLYADSNPTIYYYNESEQALEALQTRVSGNVASAVVEHFSKYILIDRTVYEDAFVWTDVWDSKDRYTGVEIVLVIDDSGSMDWNDPYNERLTVSKTLVDKLPENSRIGIVSFDSYVSTLTSSLVDSKDVAKSYLSSSYFYSSGLTVMYKGIDAAFSLFQTSDSEIMKLMVVLSDGETDDTHMHSQMVSKAVQNGVKIYTVGLGDSTRYFYDYLEPLAYGTGADFYVTENADGLADIYKDISQRIDIETDADTDGIPDYYEDNLPMFNGRKLALDKNNSDTDGDGIPDGDEVTIKYIYNSDRTQVRVEGKFYSDPTRVDSDGDCFDDKKDPQPLVWNVLDRDLAAFASLAYVSKESYTSGNINMDNRFRGYMSEEEFNSIRENWDMVEQVKEWANIDTYFEASAFKNGKSIVIAIRGTDESVGEWVNNVFGYGVVNWHVEESHAEKFALRIAQAYPGCNIYITGHSLGGYLVQYAATALYEAGLSNSVKRIAKFNAMGLDTRFLFVFDSMKDQQKALKHYDSKSKLFCYRIEGDVVSEQLGGTHISDPIEYPLTENVRVAHKGNHGDSKLEIKSGGLLYVSVWDMSNAVYTVVSDTVENIVAAHDIGNFFYHLKRELRA